MSGALLLVSPLPSVDDEAVIYTPEFAEQQRAKAAAAMHGRLKWSQA